MKRSLIYGISGQGGRHLSRCLLERNYGVHGTLRDASAQNVAGLVTLGIAGLVKFHSMADGRPE